MSILLNINDFGLNGYIQHIIENEVCKSDMYDYVLKKGKSNIVKLNYMLKDVENILFVREYDYIEKQQEYIYERIKDMQKKGEELPLTRKWSLEEHIKYVKKQPSFKLCTESQKNKRIELVKKHHRDIQIDEKALAGYDWKYENVRILKECICEEIDRLKKSKTTQNIDTKNLLSLNLTDFLNEIRQDMMTAKYNMELADNLNICNKDMFEFLKKTTDNFDLESIEKVYQDIFRWWFYVFTDKEYPYILVRIKKMLGEEAYNKTYDKTHTNLKSNQNYKNDYIECLKKRYENKQIENQIHVSMIDGYMDAINDITNNTPNNNTTSYKSLHFTRIFTNTERQNLFDGLITGCFLPKETDYKDFCSVFRTQGDTDNNKSFEPLQWTAINKKAGTPNKTSLLDFLCLLELPDNEIKNRTMLNSIFIFPKGKPLAAQNYTDYTDNTKEKKMKRPIISEYHTELLKIVSEAKK